MWGPTNFTQVQLYNTSPQASITCLYPEKVFSFDTVAQNARGTFLVCTHVRLAKFPWRETLTDGKRRRGITTLPLSPSFDTYLLWLLKELKNQSHMKMHN